MASCPATRLGLTTLNDPVLQQRAIAALMLAGATEETEAMAALRAVPDLADATADKLGCIARWALHLYPPGRGQIRPDMLAEWFLVTQLSTTPGLAAYLDKLTGQRIPELLFLLAHASDHTPAAAVPLYARLIRTNPVDYASPAFEAALTANTGRPLLDTTLAEVITSTDMPLGTLRELHRRQPAGTLPGSAAALSGEIVRHTRQIGTSEELARALLDYGFGLRDLGWHREALAAFEEGLVLERNLMAADPQYGSQIITALLGTGGSLADLGRHSEALAAFEECLSLVRHVAATDSGYVHSLANALNNVGLTLTHMGRHSEGLAASEESLALYRDLAAADAAHRPALAIALRNVDVCLGSLGRHSEGLAASEESLALYRDLADTNPAYQPALALALSGSSASLADLGRYLEALAVLEESLALYRGLAAANPAHQPDLARVLTYVSESLRDQQRYSEALTFDREAVDLYAILARRNPDRYETTYRRLLSELRRAYDLYGDQSTSIGLHLRRDNKDGGTSRQNG